ncbi:hypothetical protein PUN28_008308 [Cardiocondyla obscurior]|uniref:Uncharacterized protein n=1 Tax=Cardiocondyla obscurior TaxID=286306 RepID=A0AAW2FYH9_9HYME
MRPRHRPRGQRAPPPPRTRPGPPLRDTVLRSKRTPAPSAPGRIPRVPATLLGPPCFEEPAGAGPRPPRLTSSRSRPHPPPRRSRASRDRAEQSRLLGAPPPTALDASSPKNLATKAASSSRSATVSTVPARPTNAFLSALPRAPRGISAATGAGWLSGCRSVEAGACRGHRRRPAPPLL